jgi:hypothetical protein
MFGGYEYANTRKRDLRLGTLPRAARELQQALAKVKAISWTLNNSLEEIAALVHPEIRPVCKASIIDWPG